MDEELSNEEQNELYNKFLEALDKKEDMSSFDKDELDIIYDYAFSIEDLYARIEVVNCALRKYPESRKYNDLMVMCEYDYMPLDVVLKNAGKLSVNSFVRRLFHVFTLSDSDMTSYLTSLLEDVKPGVLDDMQVIFFGKVLINLGLTDYLEDNAGMIADRSVCSVVVYAFLYKYYINEGITEKVIKYGKAITDIDPFNDDVWGVIALYQSYDADAVDQVKDSAEYALAINPDNASALLALHIAYGDKAEYSDCLDRALASDSELYLAKYYKALSLLEKGDIEGASAYLIDYLENLGDIQSDIFFTFAGKVNKEAQDLLESRFCERTSEMSCTEIEFWCDCMLNRGLPETAEYISSYAAKYMENKGDVSQNYDYYRLRYIQYVALYVQHKHRDLIADFEANISFPKQYMGAAPLSVMYLLCKYELGVAQKSIMAEEVRVYLNMYMRSCIDLSYSTVCFGNPIALYYLQNLYMHLTGGGMPEESYNPCYQFTDNFRQDII